MDELISKCAGNRLIEQIEPKAEVQYPMVRCYLFIMIGMLVSKLELTRTLGDIHSYITSIIQVQAL
jgi:hypothetical protein